MQVLFQQGIPDVFFAELTRRGCRIERFPTDGVHAAEIFKKHPACEAVFFRANFAFGERELDLLPRLKLAALVSTGTDNLETAALTARNVRWSTGDGANAQAVFDYVIQALLCGGFNSEEHSVGVVGAGHVGSRVIRFLSDAGVRVAYYDPFKPQPGSLTEVLQCDFVTFHTALTRTGSHKTEAMLSQQYFTPARKNIRLIQTCRGGIWHRAFYQTLGRGAQPDIIAQDVYPDEPPTAADVARARYATPHIAGYSTQGRLGGILRGIRALLPDFDAASAWPEGRAWFLDAEAAAFAAAPENFTAIRDGYFWRKEFHEYTEAEEAAFREKFPRVSAAFLDALFAFQGADGPA